MEEKKYSSVDGKLNEAHNLQEIILLKIQQLYRCFLALSEICLVTFVLNLKFPI